MCRTRVDQVISGDVLGDLAIGEEFVAIHVKIVCLFLSNKADLAIM